MSDFENNSDDSIKRTPARKKMADLKAVAPLLEEHDEQTQTNVAILHKKEITMFKPNEELLQTTSRIKNQRDLIRERMSKMEQSKSRVSRTVFEKVFRDYAMQLESITHLLDEKKAVLKKELKNLYLTLEKKTLEINRHREILEEAQFRHYLEEFSEEQYKEVEEFESREITQLQSELSSVQSFLRIHEELFDPEDLGLSPKPVPKVDPEATRTVVPESLNTKASTPVEPIAQTTPPPVTPKEVPQQPLVQQVKKAVEEPAVQVSQPQETKIPVSEPVSEPELDVIDTNEADINIPEPESSIEMNPSSLDEEVEESAKPAESDFEIEDSHFTQPPQDDSSVVPAIEAEESTPDYFAAENSQPSLKIESSVSEKIEEHTSPKIAAEMPNNESQGSQSVMDILGDIALDEEISETHSHVASVSSHSIPPAVNTSQGTGEYKLVFIEAEGPIDVNEFVVRDNVSIGRSPSNDLVLKAPKASRQHAAINKYKDQYLLIDLKSSNGVFVNGKKIEEHALEEGDELSIGGYKMIFKKS